MESHLGKKFGFISLQMVEIFMMTSRDFEDEVEILMTAS